MIVTDDVRFHDKVTSRINRPPQPRRRRGDGTRDYCRLQTKSELRFTAGVGTNFRHAIRVLLESAVRFGRFATGQFFRDRR